MIDCFLRLSPAWQALCATLFTWMVTAAGAGTVIFFGDGRARGLNLTLGFAGGVMLAASYWSLLAPAIELAGELGIVAWATVSAGFLSGGLLLHLGSSAFDRLARSRATLLQALISGGKATSPGDSRAANCFKRALMLVVSVTLHNIPEGLAVGVAFGSVACGIEGATLPAACMLAVGIGLQNFPEGAAVSVPLAREGCSRPKAFFYGQLSGFVEPIAGVAGALLAMKARPLLPFMLSFAAGAMVYVVILELVPESQSGPRKAAAALCALAGFAVMMALDVGLG